MYYDFLLKRLLTHSAEKICRCNLLCFRKILVSNVFMDDRDGRSERGSITFFLSKLSCLTVQKHSISKPSVFEKLYDLKVLNG